ncbi:zinc finger and SCAN domain-containing protein 5B-like [Tenrec ecaudatus]|uniref:zinc finger and SCAN domain-containing protein 5B-like n=1 Tax=Tenrec ecaudatus TaxID=94439 RepID=UPI003F5A5C3C
MALDLTCASRHGKAANKPGADLGEHGNFKRWHVKFREFTGPEGANPLSILKQLCELCHLWLRPDLHTKKQIMDKLVLEQFLISMPPEFQVLVRESGVESCEDLEELLRSNRRPQSIVSINGKQYLLQNPDVEMVESEARDKDDGNIVCREPGSLVRETHLANGWKVTEEHRNIPETDEASRRQQEQIFLPVTTSVNGDLWILSPEQNLDKNVTEVGDGSTACVAPKPQLLQGADSVGAHESRNSGEGTSIANVDADTPYTPVVERSVSTEGPNRRECEENLGRSKRRKTDHSEKDREGHNEGPSGLAQLRPTEHGSPKTGGPGDHLAAGKQSPPKQFCHQCGFCKKLFTYKSQFDIHQRTHTGARPFKCSICGKGFMQPSDLRVHNRIHTGEKPFQCNICSSKFSHDSTLRGHKRIHTKERPFFCTLCGKCFSHKGNLNVHKRIHTGQKPYRCSDCGQEFRQLGTYRRHRKIHMKKTSS